MSALSSDATNSSAASLVYGLGGPRYCITFKPSFQGLLKDEAMNDDDDDVASGKEDKEEEEKSSTMVSLPAGSVNVSISFFHCAAITGVGATIRVGGRRAAML
jgi:hypothetical protein